jgi:predicted branched-subunit amino acid permease
MANHHSGRGAAFRRGLLHGIPIALGYLSVSFGFGILAVKSGLSVTEATLISIFNLTSAGQAAGVGIIAASGTLAEMALVQLTINIRYALMALSLSQKLDQSFTFPHRMLAAYGITDEIFGVCAAQDKPLTPAYMYGMILIAAAGWTAGTFLGASAGALLPAAVTAALGIMLYGMFLAIIIPPARKERGILFTVISAAVFSIICKYLLPMLSDGFAVIICAVTASAAAAWLFPRKEDDDA